MRNTFRIALAVCLGVIVLSAAVAIGKYPDAMSAFSREQSAKHKTVKSIDKSRQAKVRLWWLRNDSTRRRSS